MERMSQHREDRFLAAQAPHRTLQSGVISVEPTPGEAFVEAVTAAGGVVGPLGPETRGLVWLSEKRADELQAILDEHPDIEWLQLPWAGVDAFSAVLAGLATRPEHLRPVVTSAKGAYSEPVAEHALALTLGCLRQLPEKSRAAHWQPERTGLSLYENRVLLVGAGGVGQAIIDVLAPFRCDITVVRRDASQAVAGASQTVGPDDWRGLLGDIDVVILAAAQTHETASLFGRAELEALPAHAVVVNIARGPLIDTQALVWGLEAGEIFGAGLDVTDPEPLPEGHRLFDIPQCVITSHSADTPEMTRPLLAERVRHNTAAFLAGSPLRGVVSVDAGY